VACNVGASSDKKISLDDAAWTSETTVFTLDADQVGRGTDLATGRSQWREKAE